MENEVILQTNSIQAKIYMVRGEQVMLDRDLAELYGVENRVLRQAVRRNSDKFPEDFLFKLTDKESNDMIIRGVSQSVIPQGITQAACRCLPLRSRGGLCFQRF